MASENEVNAFLKANGDDILDQPDVSLAAVVREGEAREGDTNFLLEIGLQKGPRRGRQPPKIKNKWCGRRIDIRYVEVGRIEALTATSEPDPNQHNEPATPVSLPSPYWLKGRSCAGNKAMGGYSMGRWDSETSGTLGCQVRVKDSDEVYVLTNFHVAAAEASRVGDPIFQPARSDGYAASHFESMEKNGFGRLVAWKFDEFHDAALVEVTEGTDRIQGGIQGIPIGSAHGIASLNSQAAKCGRTTGVTTGGVESTNAWIKISFPQSSGFKKFKNQILSTLSAAPGDSGSILVQNGHPVGLIFAKTNTASRIVKNQAQATQEEIPIKTYTIANRLDLLFTEGFETRDGNGANLILKSFETENPS